MSQEDLFDLGDVVQAKDFTPPLKTSDIELNSKIELMYRDASNYKACVAEIVRGQFTREQLEVIREKLEDNHFFIANQVGLRGGVDLATESGHKLNEDDHVYTTFCAFFDGEKDPLSKIEFTAEDPTVEFDVVELTKRFSEVNYWDIAREMERTGLDALGDDNSENDCEDLDEQEA